MKKHDEIEKQIIATIQQFEKDVHQQKIFDEGTRTQLLKERLGRLGEDAYDCLVCTSGFDSFDSEWLFDLVWYKEEGQGKNCRLIDVPLICECELDQTFGHIKFDFEKLLVANASHHLMICNVHNNKKDFMLDYFNTAIQSFKLGRVGDRFLFAILDHESDTFSFHLLLKEKYATVATTQYALA